MLILLGESEKNKIIPWRGGNQHNSGETFTSRYLEVFNNSIILFYDIIRPESLLK